jgi:aminocarboxymuconate-semialdehyde decarboxylase
MKIDIYTHITPPKYWAAVCKKYPSLSEERLSAMTIDIKLRTMERSPEVLEVLTSPPIPPLEELLTPADQVELSRIANDEMAELVVKYPDKFLGAVAYLPLQDMDAALEEADRAITQLGFKGVLVVATLYGEQLDDPKYRPLYEKMANYDLPIWIHPCNSPKPADEPSNPIEVPPYGFFAWPLATSNSMMHLVTAGIFDDYPDLKFITHHCGGVMPLLEGRVRWLSGREPRVRQSSRRVMEHFRKFYNDTATMGTTSAIMCGYDFFGADHLLFGTDGLTQETIKAINRMDIPDADKEKIFSQNAIDLLNIAT